MNKTQCLKNLTRDDREERVRGVVDPPHRVGALHVMEGMGKCVWVCLHGRVDTCVNVSTGEGRYVCGCV